MIERETEKRRNDLPARIMPRSIRSPSRKSSKRFIAHRRPA